MGLQYNDKLMLLRSLTRNIPWTPWLVALLFLLAGFTLYGSAGHDDSHITFWASYSLTEFGEILNYNGDRVEQSSSLLLTLLTALASLITRTDVVTAGYLVTSLAGAVAIVLTWRLTKKIDSDPLFAIILLATSPAFLLWNTSGMESTLTAACVLWFLLCWGDLLSGYKSVSTASLTLASFATTCLVAVRPEMISLAAALVFLFFIWKRTTQTRGDIPILLFYSTLLLCICVLVAFRYAYFGSPMPLPVYAKVSPLSLEKLLFGFFYLLRYGIANIIFLAAGVIALIYLSKSLRGSVEKNYYLLLSSLILIAYSGFIFLTGGDWMQAGRFLVPILPLAAVFCVYALRDKKKALWIVCAAIILFNIKTNYDTLQKKSHGIPIWASYYISPEHQQRYSLFEQYNQEHLRDMDVIDTLDRSIQSLVDRNLQPVSLLSGQSGMVFFYTAKKHFRDVHFQDARGLIEKSLLKCPLLDDVPRSNQGLYFDLDKFFFRQPALQEQCNILKPDILYDINDLTRELPQRMGMQDYTLIHKDGGKMVKAPEHFPTNTLPAANFAMIANDLLNKLDKPEPVLIKFAEKPLVKR